MTDIVERLRTLLARTSDSSERTVLIDAINEIERLRELR